MARTPIRPFAAFGRAMRAFRGEAGAVTVEAALWLPFMVALLTLIVDGALIFYGQARALEVAQDGNRAFSVGSLATAEETEAFIEGRLSIISPNATAQTFRDQGLITTIVTVPTADLDAVGLFSAIASLNMQVVAQMVQEF